MKRLLPLLLTLATPALAEDAVIYADCGAQGCTCHISAISNAEIAEITGIPTPENAGQLTLVGKGGRFHWSSAPRREIDLASGGDGTCEIEVFQEVVPLDGTWAGTVEVTGIEGCHPQVAAMVPPLVEGMATSHVVAWGGKFDPARLASDAGSPVVQWTRVRSDYYTGTVPIPKNGVLDVSVDATATLLAPDQASATLSIRFDPVSGGDAGALALIGMNGCEARAAYGFRRVGD